MALHRHKRNPQYFSEEFESVFTKKKKRSGGYTEQYTQEVNLDEIKLPPTQDEQHFILTTDEAEQQVCDVAEYGTAVQPCRVDSEVAYMTRKRKNKTEMYESDEDDEPWISRSVKNRTEMYESDEDDDPYNCRSVIRESESNDADEPMTYQTERIVQNSNVKFNIDGQILHASSLSLYFVSPVFNTMFNGKFNETEQYEIDLPGKDYKAMIQFLEMVHGCDLYPSFENVFNVIPICHEYQCRVLLRACVQPIMYNHSFSVDCEMLIKTLALESKNNSKKLKQKCLSSAEISIMDKVILCDCVDYLSINRRSEMIERNDKVKEMALRILIDMGMGEGCISDHSNFRERFFTKFEAILKIFDVKK